MRLQHLQVLHGVHVEQLPFASGFNATHALRMRFRHEAAALAGRECAQLVERPGGEQHRRARRALEADAPDGLGVRFGAAKQRGKGVRADERLVRLDERDGIAPVYGLHSQAHGVASKRFVVHDGLHAQAAAQLRHVPVARDRYAFREQAIGGTDRVGDKRFAVKVRHELVRPEARAQARSHNDAAVHGVRGFNGAGHERFAFADSMVGRLGSVCGAFEGFPGHSIICTFL